MEHDMAYRRKDRNHPPPFWLTFSYFWPNPKIGRWHKRRLSKARRRAWRDPHTRGLAGVESTTNWKGW